MSFPSSSSSSSTFPITSNSPCASCKFLRRKCQPDCIFAPYFKADQSHKFISVHRVFGASNVAKLLNDLPPKYREDAINSLVYEAEMHLRDPVYGCVGDISHLHQNLRGMQVELSLAWAELARFQNASAAMEAYKQSLANGYVGEFEGDEAS